jgi:hypothetical protein
MTDVRARTRSGARTGLRFVVGGLIAVLALFATACGNNNIDLGTPVITLTTNSGQFTSYIVTIDDIILTQQDGTIAEPLSTPQRVDLAQLSNVVQLLEAPAAQTGSYVSATITLDYATIPAVVTVNVNGQSVPATLVDVTTGAAPTTETFTVQFDPAHPMVITKGQSALAALNIDLEASNSIHLSASAATVTVMPFMTVNSQPVYNKPILARGLFVVADTTAGTFDFNTRPLNDLVSALGALKVQADANTYYNINGVTYTGAAGLAAVAVLPENEQIAVMGTPTAIGGLSGITPTFNATAVYAGTSLESTIADNLTGVVSARSGNTLTVQGASLVTRLDLVTGQADVLFANTATLTIGASTIVSQDGVIPAAPLNTASISVGQNIKVAGQAQLDASGNLTGMDATAGQVRLQPTTLWGTQNSAVSGSLSLDLLSVNNLDPTVFNFTGTGMNSGLDATPASYAVNTGSIDASQNAVGTLLKIDGFASAFGSAPPDFNATAVTLGTSADSQLIVEWDNGGTTVPFSVWNADGIIIDLSNQGLAGTLHVIRTGPTSVNIGSLPSGMVISTLNASVVNQSAVVLAIGDLTDSILTVNDSQEFANAITGILSGGTRHITKLVAVGHYDPATNTFNAQTININAQQ